jgi:hypothetical protein
MSAFPRGDLLDDRTSEACTLVPAPGRYLVSQHRVAEGLGHPVHRLVRRLALQVAKRQNAQFH